MSKYTDIDEWSKYWMREIKSQRSYWEENGTDDFQFKIVFDSSEASNHAWKEVCDFWDGGGWGDPEGYIDFEDCDKIWGVYLTCPETPLVIRVARNYEGCICGWNSRFLEEPPLHIPYWIPSNYRLELRKKKEKKAKSGCYIATAVYGSYDCPQVWTLRRYRDNVLDKSWYGRLFIQCYYTVSPTLVKWFGQASWFRNMFRKPLSKWIAKLNKHGFEDTPYIDKY